MMLKKLKLNYTDSPSLCGRRANPWDWCEFMLRVWFEISPVKARKIHWRCNKNTKHVKNKAWQFRICGQDLTWQLQSRALNFGRPHGSNLENDVVQMAPNGGELQISKFPCLAGVRTVPDHRFLLSQILVSVHYCRLVVFCKCMPALCISCVLAVRFQWCFATLKSFVQWNCCIKMCFPP